MKKLAKTTKGSIYLTLIAVFFPVWIITGFNYWMHTEEVHAFSIVTPSPIPTPVAVRANQGEGAKLSTTSNRVANQVTERLESGNSEGVVDLIKKYFGEDARLATAIFTCESNLNPKAVNHNSNGTEDRGLAQVNSVHGFDPDRLFEPEYNIRSAKRVWDSQGPRAWSCFNSKAYLKHI